MKNPEQFTPQSELAQQNDSENNLENDEVVLEKKEESLKNETQQALDKAKESRDDKDIEIAEELLKQYKEVVYKRRGIETIPQSITQTYKTPEGQTETIEFNLEQQMERFNTFYSEEDIEIPDDFEQQIKKLWSENQTEIKQAIEQYGYDEILFIPPYDTQDINNKTTKEYNDTWESDNFKKGGSFSGITDTKENKTKIVLIHKDKDMERPELNKTKGKSIYDLCNAKTDTEKQQIDELIKNKQPLPIEGLTLAEYLIADRLYFKETNSHLDDVNKSWTWLPNSYSGERIASSLWNPGISRVNVAANTPDHRNSLRGCRFSRTII